MHFTQASFLKYSSEAQADKQAFPSYEIVSPVAHLSTQDFLSEAK